MKKKLTKWDIVRNWLSRIFLALMVCFSIIAFIQIFFPAHALNLTGFRVFSVSGTRSMEPTFYEYDMVFVTGRNFNTLQARDEANGIEGDIVVFWARVRVQGQYHYIHLVHRIVERIETDDGVFFRTQGDHERARVDPILMSIDGNGHDYSLYVGTVTTYSRSIGQLFAFLASPYGFSIVALNIIGFALISYLLKAGFSEEAEEWELDTVKIEKRKT